VTAATDPPTLAVTPDEIDAARVAWEAKQAHLTPATLIAPPSAQLALDMAGVPAQLGLDGVAYGLPAPAADEPRAEGPSRTLGTPHGVLPPDYEAALRVSLGLEYGPPRPSPCGDRANRDPAPHHQLELDLNAWDAVPQLDMWDRRDLMAAILRCPRDCPRPERTDGKKGCAIHLYDRDAKCLRTRFVAPGEAIELRRSSSAKWSLVGVIQCGQMTCPHCGPDRCRDAAARIAVSIERHLAESDDNDVWMLTLSPPHYADDDPAEVVDRLFTAIAAFWRTVEWRHFAERWGIDHKIRALDISHGGPNGMHPHFHVLAFPTKARCAAETRRALAAIKRREDERAELLEAAMAEKLQVPPPPYEGSARQFLDRSKNRTEPVIAVPLDGADLQPLGDEEQRVRELFLRELRASLLPAWERCVRATGARIKHDAKFRAVSLDLAPCERAYSYVVKWGLADEVGAPTAKHHSHLRLLDALGAGMTNAAELYKQTRHATAGRTWLVGLGDLCHRYEVNDADVQNYLDELHVKRERKLAAEGKPIPEPVPELRLEVRARLYESVLALGPKVVFAFVDSFDHATPLDEIQRQLDAFLWESRALVRSRDTS
jgi:hypothetical protein